MKKAKSLYLFGISFLSVILAGAIGGVANSTSLTIWYSHLAKPSLVPPGYVFGIVWTVLYFLMAISLYLVWKKRSAKTTLAVKVFYLQLVLNISWSIVFFGFHQIFFGLVDIIFLLGVIIFTMVLFSRISKTAMYLFLPYLLWVIFATYLNWQIFLLNRVVY